MKKKDLLIIFLLFLCTLPSVLPLLHHGFFQTDDGEWMIIRLSAFYQALHDGEFPVRFLQRLNFGYGYPVAEFLYPGSFYVGSLLHVIRFGFVNSVKIIYGISLIGSAFFTYFWLSKLFRTGASFIGALFSLYIPYHLYDVYIRGSFEVFALLWVPLILWQLERKSRFWVSCGIGLLLLSHNTIALLFLPILFLYGLLRKIYPLRQLVILFVLGISLSAFFIIPAVMELHYTVFSQTAVSNPLDYFANLPLIGYAVLLILFIILGLLFMKIKRIKQYTKMTLFFFLLSLLTLALATPVSSSFWHLPQASFIQFPFRLLSYLLISSAFLAAVIVSVFKDKYQWGVGIILLGILGYSAFPYSNPTSYFDKGEGYYYTNDATTTVKDEYLPIWVKQKATSRPNQQVIFFKGTGKMRNLIQTNKSLGVTVEAERQATIQANIIYWPGWHVLMDGSPIAMSYANADGVIKVDVPKGTHRLEFVFGENRVRFLADLLSILAFLCLCYFTRHARDND